MNQTFLSFTFKSDAPTFLLFETEQGAQITIEDGQSIAFDQIDDVIEALKAIKASGAKKQGNGEEGNGEESRQNNAPPIPDGIILPPFNFDTPQKLNALLGRTVRLMNRSVHAVESVDLAYDCSTGAQEAIYLAGNVWLYKDGKYCNDGSQSEFDMVEVFAK